MIEHFRGAWGLRSDGGVAGRRRCGACAGFAKRLNAPLAIIDKRREEANVAEVMHIIGDVRGRNCLIVDDLIDTAGTLVKGGEALLEAGRRACGHARRTPCFQARRLKRIEESQIEEVVVTNSIPLKDEAVSVRPDSHAVGRAAAGAGHSVDPRRRFDQHVVCLAGNWRRYTPPNAVQEFTR